jgi:hypothetical protein
MDQEERRPARRPRSRLWGAAAAVAAATGAALLVVGISAQQAPPAPPARVAGTVGQAAAATAAPAGSGAPTGGTPAGTTPAGGITGPDLPRSEPTALQIPRIGVRSGFERLGVNPDQSIQVPRSYSEAGWFTSSVTPGQIGPLVVLGHVDSHDGPGVFYRLGDLRPGDVVTVRRADGRAVDYRITGVREYPKDDFPTIDVYANTPVPTVRLITCGGSFDAATGHYTSNVIAYGQSVGT